MVEVSLVGFFLILASQYWAVQVHAVYLSLCLFALLLWWHVGPSLRSSTRGLLTAIPFLLFLGWIAISVIWSPNAHLSFSYALMTVLIGVTAILLGAALGLRQIISGAVFGVGFLVAHVFLTSGFPGDGSDWGLFTNRSDLSFLIGVALVALSFLGGPVWWRWVFAPVLAVFLLFGLVSALILTSFFSLAGAAYVALALFHVRKVRPGRQGLVGGSYLLVAVSAVAAFWIYREPLLALIGEGPDFSRRIPIWQAYFEAFLWRPLLGSGWGNSAGWPPLEESRLSPVVNFFPAHNGFIDTGLVLGIVGILLLVGTLLALFSRGVSLCVQSNYPRYFGFVPAMVVYLALNDLAATSLPRFIGIFLLGTMIGSVVRQSAIVIGEETPAALTQSREERVSF